MVSLSLLAASRHWGASAGQACPCIGHTPCAGAAQVQRVEVARLLVELAMQSALMRDTLQDEHEQRREQRRELHELRMKFKRCGSAAGPSGCCKLGQDYNSCHAHLACNLQCQVMVGSHLGQGQPGTKHQWCHGWVLHNGQASV